MDTLGARLPMRVTVGNPGCVIRKLLTVIASWVIMKALSGAIKLSLALIKSHAKYISNVTASPASRTSPLSSYRERETSNKDQANK